MKSSCCDIILPVYNSLTFVKECVHSILSNTKDCDYRFYILDDHSDYTTSRYLTEVAKLNPHVVLKRNSKNLGYVKSCNSAISLGTSPYILLINSDVMVTPEWLFRLLECIKSDYRIASINPLANRAGYLSFPMVQGSNFLDMNWFLQKNSRRQIFDVPVTVGFCMLMRRSMLVEVGLFDEIYGRGYGEESDLCMRFLAKGYRNVVTSSVYVYHKGRATFGENRVNLGRKIFDDRWGSEFVRLIESYREKNEINQVCDLFPHEVAWDPRPTIRDAVLLMKERFWRGEIARAIWIALIGLNRSLGEKRPIATPRFVSKVTRPNKLRITYLLPNTGWWKEGSQIVQLVNELILLGAEARIVTLKKNPAILEDATIYSVLKTYFMPIVFSFIPELKENFPESEIVVATDKQTALWAAEVVKEGKAKRGVYCEYEYENPSFREYDAETIEKVSMASSILPHVIVQSAQVKCLLEKENHYVKYIKCGIDLSIFYPRKVLKVEGVRILVKRNINGSSVYSNLVLSAITLVKKVLPDAEVHLFGGDLSSMHLPFTFKDEGKILNQDRLAQLYSSSDVFINASHSAGDFDRTTLQAMACGTVCVIPKDKKSDGIAYDGVNCLFSGNTSESIAVTILSIIHDGKLIDKLKNAGLDTVAEYTHKQESRDFLKIFEAILNTEDKKTCLINKSLT